MEKFSFWKFRIESKRLLGNRGNKLKLDQEGVKIVC